MNNEEISRVFARIEKLREEGKLPPITPEDYENEPTALAFTPDDKFYFSDGEISFPGKHYTEDDVRELIIKALTHNDYDLCGSLVTRDGEIRTANFNVWFEENK